MDNKFECDLTRDLLPIYLEGATCDESNHFLQNHLETCEECRAICELMREELPADIMKVHRPKRRRRLHAVGKLTLFVIAYLIVVIMFLYAFGHIFVYGF
ncbi:MAG: zf-HC2 domain-containing protein [Acetatifactor sp.]|nr:zf-HC2 domain-containing protein [Acetatifactor sp.]